ncbi:MarR family transcriptional regulator [Saccharomonospora sp. NPDC046836]|uniref:MarR family winged helix-turn-helix transcriptional regulator n=1 Tax=Saccharomonospora sp. NPDC046836 TaxID=3156921 RepID=UPI0033C8391B
MAPKKHDTRQPPSSISAKDLDGLLAETVSAQVRDLDQEVLRAATNLKRAATVLDQLEIRHVHGANRRTPAAFRVLVMIWAFGPIEAKDVSRLSGVSRQAVSGVLATLERDGLVSRERATKADKRLVPVTITQDGAELVEANLLPQHEVQQKFFEALSPDEVRTLIQLLSRIIVAAHDYE